MKKTMIVVVSLLVAGMLLSACSAFSPVKYAAQMTPILKDFDNWYTGDFAMYHQLLATKTKMDPKLTYGDLVMGTVYTYRIGKGVSPSKSWNAADIMLFQNLLQMMHDSGSAVLAKITEIAPPEDIKDAHIGLQKCLQYQKDVSGSLLDIFNKGTFTQVEYETNPCTDVDSNLVLVKLYVSQNSGN